MFSTHATAVAKRTATEIRPRFRNWEDIALWLFIAVLFIASASAAYLFALKCDPPAQ